MIGPSLAVTKILYYRSQTQDFHKSCSRRLGEYLDRFMSSSDQQWIFGKHFRFFGSTFSKWTILLRDTRPLARPICKLLAIILQQFGPLDLGMTLTLKVKVKVNRSTRDPSNKKGSIGLSCIVTELQALQVYKVCWYCMWSLKCSRKDGRCSKKHFFFLTLKGHFKVKVKVKEIAHSSQFVKGYLVLKFDWSIFSRYKDPYYRSQIQGFSKIS